MALETLNDVLEDILNRIGVYGCCPADANTSHVEYPLGEACGKCRVCMRDELNTRIRRAIETEQALERGRSKG